ncbi:DNA-binding CsgD family transcriptional regulator [Variovorax sp. TBS-050B]|uniref:helix-turn-helix transcriptional regulator n=1 Tax=Variovorax sp. TBS-050B TaxID=2940551 RepID=UPI00247329CB|nr:LuxR family transcriptional regulator [Variovorax sp. TBS-050B]MDH6594290.1 DNA-binding CsgD family transcriptional regulator [Variovorax sp. TBS-050B]
MISSNLLPLDAAASLPDARDIDPALPPRQSAELPLDGPFPQLYSEEQLYLPPSADRRADGAPGIVGDLLDARDAEARRELVQDLLDALGFDWLAYGTVTYLRGRWWPLSFYTAHANPEWTQRYFSHRLYEMDLRQPGVPASSLPLVWDVEQIEAMPVSAATSAAEDPAGLRQRFVDDLRLSGIHSGLMFRLASPTQVNLYTVISLQSSEPGRRWITDDVVGHALTLGLSLHEYLSRHSRMPSEAGAAARIEISSTQQSILQHLLQGRSDKEIANHLDLSAHTVDYHMRQLRRRFAARNRVQLVNAVQQSDSDFGVLSDF